ncbi:hypothetical protein [Streptomyces sp. NBC_01443]|uniref:hypothetical protein n=1 Tax=Streptomyces sp. NBC_01443 TaxID=2903868 RepID=UPI002256AAD3|nr:hypothetical protein [Streptomyces sp. NBC_01443]MCX4625469.1 hypothetical protein [Streptomyces sp. NBC_01443]
MSCYLCAYGASETPDVLQPLPPDSPSGANDDLGTCKLCSVWACSLHGTRYGAFECAVCTPASATQQALVAGTVGNAAATQAHVIGLQASDDVRGGVRNALRAVLFDHQRASATRADTRSLVAQGEGEPNLVANLADVIYQQIDSRSVAAVRGRQRGNVSFDAVGGAVRAAFLGREFLEATEDAETTVAGALLLAYHIANADADAQRLDDSRYWTTVEVRPPWKVSRPVLLDPVMWMMGTAYALERETD